MHCGFGLNMNTIDFVVQLPFSWRQRRAVGLRADMTRERFIAALAVNELEERAAGLLWDKLLEVAIVPAFKPHPNDNFLKMYGLADEDLDEDVIIAIFKSLGLELPSSATLQNVGKVDSPSQFILLLRLSRKS
jgi:hypothetical protein